MKTKNTRFFKKNLTKDQKEQAVLFTLIELYLQNKSPIGSHSLQEFGLDFLSSATIRNYFAKLEEKGLLKQQHISGGRVPTELAYREYAKHHIHHPFLNDKEAKFLRLSLSKETKKVNQYLQQVAETLSDGTCSAVFLSSPRFDQDFIRDIKLITLEPEKILAILITDLGVVHTEPIYVTYELTDQQLKILEHYFLWRISQKENPHIEDPSLLKMAQRLYNEILVRHVVNYANAMTGDVYKTGLSKLLTYPEFANPTVLSYSLSLLESPAQMQSLLNACIKKNDLCYWIGKDLDVFSKFSQNCTIIAIPYYIHHIPVGAIAILTPMNINYKKNFAIMKVISDIISDSLTASIYKYKISFQAPNTKEDIVLSKESILLENKSPIKQ